MSNVRPLDDVSNIIDLDALHKELEQARSNVEMWMARRELSLKEQVAVHKTNMAVAEEEYVSLVEREKDLAAAAEELARRQEYQQAELDTLQEEAAQAKELGEDLPQQLQVLREQIILTLSPLVARLESRVRPGCIGAAPANQCLGRFRFVE